MKVVSISKNPGMKKYLLTILFTFGTLFVIAQMDSLSKARFVIGLSTPELFHAGGSIDLGKSNQIGVSAGVGPTWGGVWPTLNIEHRLYFGKLSEITRRKTWFFRQGATTFTESDHQRAITLSLGADLKSKYRNRGWTIDLGAFLLLQNDVMGRTDKIGPALHFQYYSFFKRAKK
jgi:hypothetical protein